MKALVSVLAFVLPLTALCQSYTATARPGDWITVAQPYTTFTPQLGYVYRWGTALCVSPTMNGPGWVTYAATSGGSFYVDNPAFATDPSPGCGKTLQWLVPPNIVICPCAVMTATTATPDPLAAALSAVFVASFLSAHPTLGPLAPGVLVDSDTVPLVLTGVYLTGLHVGAQ